MQNVRGAKGSFRTGFAGDQEAKIADRPVDDGKPGTRLGDGRSIRFR